MAGLVHVEPAPFVTTKDKLAQRLSYLARQAAVCGRLPVGHDLKGSQGDSQ